MTSTISKMTKEIFGENEAFVIGDFAKDYQFLIQDDIQSYHWSKEYCKLHPLVVYYLVVNLSQVQTMLVDYLKANRPHIKKLI